MVAVRGVQGGLHVFVHEARAAPSIGLHDGGKPARHVQYPSPIPKLKQ